MLWSGGISFGGVLAFIFADLIVLPIIAIYRKYYGWPFAIRITGAHVRDHGGRGARDRRACSAPPASSPPRGRPETDVFGQVELDYKFVLNVIASPSSSPSSR